MTRHAISISSCAGKRMWEMLARLHPLHRTINSDDTEAALILCGEFLGDQDGYALHRFPPGSEAYTWLIPERYQVRQAWLEIAGERVADFARNPLHLLSYSLPQRIEGRLEDLRGHLWTNPKRPWAIPWEFKYYERSWGFCLRHADLERFPADAPAQGVIDVEFGGGDLVVGDYFLPGETDCTLLFLTNICHPCQSNDSLAGLVVALEMARILKGVTGRRYGFRVLVAPEMIGTIAWASRNEDALRKTEYAWFCEMVGHDQSFILQHSRQGDSLIDRAFKTVLASHRRHGEERHGPFRKVVASDELVTNGPGFDIPTPSLTRWPYDEYHTSDDNPTIVKPENLEETLRVMLAVWDALENNYYPIRTFTGPVMLSRYGLWVDWREDWGLNLATEQIMLMLEGNHSIIDIAYETNLPLDTVRRYVDRFHDAGLVRLLLTPVGSK